MSAADKQTPAELEREADRLLLDPKARRLRAKIESESFTENDGRAMYDSIGKQWENALEITAQSARDIGEVAGFEFGCWAGKDPVRQFAVRVVRGRSSESVRHFAAIQRVSESLVHRRIREAKRFACSLVTAA